MAGEIVNGHNSDLLIGFSSWLNNVCNIFTLTHYSF